MVKPLRTSEIDACLHKIELKRTEPYSRHRSTPSDEQERRRKEAEQLREKILARLVEAHPGAQVASSSEHTRELLLGGTEIILRGRLDSFSGRLSATFPVLVRVGRTEENYSYAPLIIKNHEITEAAVTRSLHQTTVAHLLPTTGEEIMGLGLRSTVGVRRDTLALSGMSRVLADHGLHDPHWRGGVVDRRGDLYWLPLDSPLYPKANLAYFDELLAERYELLAAMDQKAPDSMVSEPYWHRECTDCEFAEFCQPALERLDDVSLVRFSNYSQQQLLRANGVSTRAQLANLDPKLAQRAKLHPTSVDGVESVISPSFDRLDELIYRARSFHRQSMLRILEPAHMGCPTADVEVDVDMESYGDGTYLWGAYVTTSSAIEGVSEGYRSFGTFEELTFEREQQIFQEFWLWFVELRACALAADKTFAGYCFWEHAENSAMNRAVTPPLPDGPTLADLEAFRSASPSQWFDLHAYAKNQIQTEGPLGLKQLAVAAGFQWRDEAPSGEASMSWYEIAVGQAPVEALASQERLLQYNEDDCRATKALRHWLNNGAQELAHRDEYLN
jgi:predicted RecB family nuclease